MLGFENQRKEYPRSPDNFFPRLDPPWLISHVSGNRNTARIASQALWKTAAYSIGTVRSTVPGLRNKPNPKRPTNIPCFGFLQTSARQFSSTSWTAATSLLFFFFRLFVPFYSSFIPSTSSSSTCFFLFPLHLPSSPSVPRPLIGWFKSKITSIGLLRFFYLLDLLSFPRCTVAYFFYCIPSD